MNDNNIEYNLINFPNQPPEIYYGNKEYKINLNYKKTKNLDKILDKKASQMLFRIVEGNGKALYFIGINDNGDARGIDHYDLIESLKNLENICNKINANIKKIRIYKGIEGYIATIRIFINEKILDDKNIFNL